MSNMDEAQALQSLFFLDPQSSARVCHTSKSGVLAKAATNALLWDLQMSRAFGLSSADAQKGPGCKVCESDDGTAVGSARAFGLWYRAASDIGVQCVLSRQFQASSQCHLPAKWIELWHRMRKWLSNHAPEVLDTLQPPATSSAIDSLNQMVGMETPPAVVGLWRICDGQIAHMEPYLAQELQMPTGEHWSRGLLGGYVAYDHCISTILLPLRSALKLTARLRENIDVLNNEHPTKVAFACAHSAKKILLVDVKDGRVYAFRREEPFLQLAVPSPNAHFAKPGARVQLQGLKSKPALNGKCGTLVAYVPGRSRWQCKMDDGSGITLIKDDNIAPENPDEYPFVQQDNWLQRWFEEYLRRLEQGVYIKMPLRPEEAPATAGICLFPTCGEWVSKCVTRGVQVTGSCIYMPEHLQGWTYSISFRLVENEAERGYKTCQLYRRQWQIKEDGGEPDIVNGEGVVGFFPILADGGWLLNRESDPNRQYSGSDRFMSGEFRYQSFSGRSASMSGWFGGSLTFMPGTLRNQTGQPFQVRLEPFRLMVPEFVY